MKNKHLYILFFIFTSILACSKYKTEQIHGTWNFVSIKNEKGKKLSIRPEIELDFDAKGNYDYVSIVKNEEYSEQGSYYLQNDIIVLKNGVEEALTKQIKIVKLNRDTMLLKMKNVANDIQFLTLYKAKTQAIEADSLNNTEDEDLGEKTSDQPVKKKKK